MCCSQVCILPRLLSPTQVRHGPAPSSTSKHGTDDVDGSADANVTLVLKRVMSERGPDVRLSGLREAYFGQLVQKAKVSQVGAWGWCRANLLQMCARLPANMQMCYERLHCDDAGGANSAVQTWRPSCTQNPQCHGQVRHNTTCVDTILRPSLYNCICRSQTNWGAQTSCLRVMLMWCALLRALRSGLAAMCGWCSG